MNDKYDFPIIMLIVLLVCLCITIVIQILSSVNTEYIWAVLLLLLCVNIGIMNKESKHAKYRIIAATIVILIIIGQIYAGKSSSASATERGHTTHGLCSIIFVVTSA